LLDLAYSSNLQALARSYHLLSLSKSSCKNRFMGVESQKKNGIEKVLFLSDFQINSYLPLPNKIFIPAGIHSQDFIWTI
jgi:hypothetical protein